MTVITPAYIPEDAWVRNARRVGKVHRVFSTNYDVLTYCGRWLKRDTVRVGPAIIRGADDMCLACNASAQKVAS